MAIDLNGSERRASERRWTLKRGVITFDQAGASIDCLVRNLSDNGALLLVGNQTDIPNSFDLLLRTDGLHKQCRIVWRSVDRMGVAFAEEMVSARCLD